MPRQSCLDAPKDYKGTGYFNTRTIVQALNSSAEQCRGSRNLIRSDVFLYNRKKSDEGGHYEEQERLGSAVRTGLLQL